MMPLSTDRVFIDTGAFIALAAKADQHYESATAIYRRLLHRNTPLLTTNHIVDETCAFLLRDDTLGHRAAIRFGEFIRDVSVPARITDLPGLDMGSRRLVLIYSSPEIEELAWDVLSRYGTAGFTFTDCTSFAVMSMLRIRKAFAFDSHFDVMGFERL